MDGTVRFGLVALLSEAGFFACLLILPIHTAELGYDATTTGLVLGAYSFASLICAPLWGRLTDGLGRRRSAIALGFAVYAVASASIAVVEGPALMLGLRIAQGAGFAVMPVLTAFYGDALGERAGRGFGLYSAAAALGLALGSIGGGTVAELGGIRSVFLVSALLAAASSAIVLGLLPEESPVRRRPTRSSSAWPRHLSLYLLVLVRHASAMAIWSIFAVFLNQRFDDLGTIGWLVGVNLLAQPGFRILLVRVTVGRPRRRGRVLVASLFATTLGLGGFAYATEIWQLVALQVLVAAACAGVITGVSLHLLEHSPEDERGTSFGYLQSMFHGAGVVGPIVAGLCADAIGLRWTIVTMACVALVALPMARAATLPGGDEDAVDRVPEPVED